MESQTALRSKKSNVRTRSASCWTASGREDADGVDDVLDASAAARRHVVGEAHHGDDKRDVGLDGLDDLGERHAVAADEGEQAVARLGERRKAFECLECRGQAAAMAFARPHLLERSDCGARCRRWNHGAVWLAAIEVLCSSVSLARWSSRIRARARLGVHRAGYRASFDRQPRPKRVPHEFAIDHCASVSSRPSTATVSKMPGRDRAARQRDPQRLVDLRRLAARAARRSRSSAASIRADLERLGSAASASRTSREHRAPVLVEPALARRRVVGRAVVDEAAQRPEVGKRLELLGADRGRRAKAVAAVEGLERGGQLVQR